MKKLALVLFAFALITGCKREPTTWDVDGLVPLAYSKVTLEEAVPDENIASDSNGALSLIYKGNLFELSLDSIFQIPDTSAEDEFFLPIGTVTLQPGQTFKADTVTSPYDMNGAQITYFDIRSGIFHVFVESTLAEPMILEYAIPSATKNGQMFFVKETIPSGTIGSPTYVDKDYDLSGYAINLTGENNDAFNLLRTEYRVYVDSAGVPLTIVAGDRLRLGNTLQSIRPSYARGYFGNELLTESAEGEAIDAFNNIVSGNITLEKTTMQFNIINELGVDIRANIGELTGKNNLTNLETSLTGPIINTDMNLNRSTETNNASNPVIGSTYSQELNETNSNVTDFIGVLPNELSYAIEVQINPLGNVSGSNDFVYDSTGIKLALDVEIPLKLQANNLVILDTAEFNIDSTSQEEVGRITGGFLNLYATNWYPWDIEAQIYLMDENYMVIDSIFGGSQVLLGGQPNPDEVTIPSESVLKAPVSKSKIDNLYRAVYVESKLRINTVGSTPTTIFDTYYIDMNLVGDFTYLVTIN